MAVKILSITLFFIFTIISGFHFYWFFGGIWGLKKVIPTKNNRLTTLSVPKIATLLVSVMFVIVAIIYLLKSNILDIQYTNTAINYMFWIVPFVFILRAIGEFNYVGFFKKIKNTEFSKADSNLFSPLCLLIGVVGLYIQFVAS